MVLYLDTSALLKRYVAEPESEDIIAKMDEATAITTALIAPSTKPRRSAVFGALEAAAGAARAEAGGEDGGALVGGKATGLAAAARRTGRRDVLLFPVAGGDHLLPFAGPAVVVAVHAPLIRTMAPRDTVGMIAPQRRAVAVRPTPRSGRARRGRLTRR